MARALSVNPQQGRAVRLLGVQPFRRTSQASLIWQSACDLQLVLKVRPVMGKVSFPAVEQISTPYSSCVGTSLAFT